MFDKLQEELETYLSNKKVDPQDKEIVAFWLKNLNISKDLSLDLKNKIIKINEIYKYSRNRKLPYPVREESLLGLIAYLNKTNNSKRYSLKSLAFLGYCFGDYNEEELDKFIKSSPTSKMLKTLREKIGDYYFEEEYYLNHYDNLATLSKDLETKTLEEIRQETGYYNVPNYEDDGSYNNGGGNHI